MNQKKVKKQINKINSFFDSIIADEEVSKIEKDLLLNYVRKLYETILDEPTASKNRSEKKSSAPAPEKKQTTKQDAPTITAEPTASEPVVTERKPFERVKKEITTPTSTEPIAIQQEETIVAEPIVQETIIQVPSTTTSNTLNVPDELSDNMQAIFLQSRGSELSDRLSNLPIKDLTKSMGINERVLTINELFGGDSNKLNSVLQDLNGLSSYDQAKAYLLENVAHEHNWDTADKYKKAIKFVKLVQRRYS